MYIAAAHIKHSICLHLKSNHAGRGASSATTTHKTHAQLMRRVSFFIYMHMHDACILFTRNEIVYVYANYYFYANRKSIKLTRYRLPR